MRTILVENWPKLAWCAICDRGSDDIQVLHGPRIETQPDWFGEVAWAGDYSAAAFDETDIVAGSGARRRGDNIVFVGAGSIVDRLHFLRVDERYFVSNSLPGLLSVADASLDPTYPEYYADLRSIDSGLPGYRREYSSDKGQVEFVYFDNLVWDGNELTRRSKPNGERRFSDYDDYYGFLVSSMREMGENIRAPERNFSFEMIATASSGYDSPTVAAIAKTGGCQRALTIDKSRAGDSDSGAEIGRYLGLDTYVANRDAWRSEKLAELPFIAGGPGGGGSVYFKSAEGQLTDTVLFTGLGGGLMWGDPKRTENGEFVPIGFSDASLAEYRLSVGFIHCAPPLWGMRNPESLFDITESEELIPWRVPGNYNRPIARRIVESAGVPREEFGMIKRAAAFMLHQPFSAGESLSESSAADFNAWLRETRGEWLRRGKLPPSRVISALSDVLLRGGIIGLGILKRVIPNAKIRAVISNRQKNLGHLARRPPGSVRRYTFPWAISRMRSRYKLVRGDYEALS